MQYEHLIPWFFGVVRGFLDADSPVAEYSIQPLVPDVTHAVESELGRALAEEDGGEVGDLAEVVDQAHDGEDVDGAEVAVSARVVVIPVYGEHRDGDVQVLVLIVHGRESARAPSSGMDQLIIVHVLRGEIDGRIA